MLGYAMRRIGRHAHNRHAMAHGSREIDIVVSSGPQRNPTHAATGKHRDSCSVGVIVNKQAHGICACRQRCRCRVEPRLEKNQLVLAVIRGAEKRPVVGFAAEHNNSHDREADREAK